MKSTKYTALTAALTLAAAAVIRPFSAEALSVTDVRHLVKSLTAQGALIVDDDFNGDGKVNAVDLTLMKRSLFAEPDDDTGEVKSQTVPVSEENSKLIGRTLEKDGVTWLVHSGSAMECTVTGTEASVTICGDGGINSDAFLFTAN